MWKVIKRLDNYRRSVLAMLFIAPALLLYLILNNAPSLLLSDWFLDVITIPMFVSNLISSSTYIGRLFDFSKQDFPVNDNDPINPGRKRERFGTWFGLILGLAVGILFSCLHVALPFTSSLCVFANALFTFNKIGALAGLGGRIGICADSARSVGERKSIAIAAIAGIAAGIALFLTTKIAMISIIGVTTIITGGAVLPMWVAGMVFVTAFTSTLTGFADYASKAWNYVFERQKNDQLGRSIREEKPHEYRGSFAGASIGLLMGGAIITLLAITQPHIFAGAVVAIALASLIIATTVNVMGGLGSRIGRLIDGFKQQESQELEADLLLPKEVPVNTLSKDDGGKNRRRSSFCTVTTALHRSRQRSTSGDSESFDDFVFNGSFENSLSEPATPIQSVYPNLQPTSASLINFSLLHNENEEQSGNYNSISKATDSSLYPKIILRLS